MAMTIDGATNTVTGLSVGGLPDDTVDSDTLANNIDIAGTLDVTGATTFDAVISADAGIDFSGAQTNLAGMTSETLDAYEEGTWTPELIGWSTPGNPTYGSATKGIYTKTGRHVTAAFIVTLTDKDTIGGDVQISLPFTPTNFDSSAAHGQGGFCSQVKNMATTVEGVMWRVRWDAAKAYMQPIKSGTSPANSYGTDSDLEDDTMLCGTIIYAST
jgi:hypothetical protein